MKFDAIAANQGNQNCIGLCSPCSGNEFRHVDVPHRHQPVQDDALPEIAQYPTSRSVHLAGPDVIISDESPSLNPAVLG